MCQIASLLLLQRLKRSMSGNARFQQHRDASGHRVFFLERQGTKGNSRQSDKH